MYHVNLDDAKARLPDLVNAAAGGEDVYIEAGDRQIFQLVPVQSGSTRPKFGSAAGLIKMSEDFDVPLPDFREYT